METNLYLKTEFSLCKSTFDVETAVDLASSFGIKNLAICDDGNVFAGLEFAKGCISKKIKPIIGVKLNLSLFGKLVAVFLYAKNFEGYQNILHITAFLQKDGVVLFDDEFKKWKDHLICVCSECDERIVFELSCLFLENYFIGITRYTNYKTEIDLENILISLAIKLNLPIVAVCEAYFDCEDNFEAADVLRCIGENRYQIEDDRDRYTKKNYLWKPQEFQEIFADLPEAIENLDNIAKKCNFCPLACKPMLPTFASDENAEMQKQAIEGFEQRLKDGQILALDKFSQEEYKKRLDFEIDVISKMGFCGYFLIVSDFIKWSKNNEIAVGPGRGSGAGSLVAFCLYITDLDPLYYGLLFERFLNPERVSMPDFDIDFCQERRGEVIEYVKNKYGEKNVASIITFGKLQARAVLKDVGRVLQMPYFVVDKICKMVPFNPVDPVTLAKAIDMDKELQKQIEEDDIVKKLIELGLKLEGLNRHSSTHAAGIIIGNKPLSEFVPVSVDEDGMQVVGYSMKYAEMAGLVKFDFLGLKTLTVISNTIKFIKKFKGIDLDISKIDMRDKKTFEMLQKGLTRGVFQLDSAVCKDAMHQMKIDKVEDIIALTSLNRPGPMENIPSYIKRKIGVEKVVYPHYLLELVLGETYGIVIYQEQVMQIAQVLSGYSLGQADLLRRAMGKKIKEEMEAQRKIFVDGAILNGVSENKASEIFDLVEKFAGYGFNKSHAAAYSVISYYTAYLKANFSREFIVANLNICINDTDDLNFFINEARDMGLKVLKPDVNSSNAFFEVDLESENGIKYALAGLKGIGAGVVSEICEIRNIGGKFVDIFDLCKRCGKRINKKVLESLAKSGSLDLIFKNRKMILENFELLIKYAADSVKEEDEEIGLFGESEKVLPKPRLVDCNDYSENERLMLEFESFGFYFSGHPLEFFKSGLSGFGVVSSKHLNDVVSTKEIKVKMAGVVVSIKQRSGKRGRFAFLGLSDLDGIYETAIFSDKLISEKRDLLLVGKVILIEAGAVTSDDGGYVRIMVNDIKDISSVDFSKYANKDINPVFKMYKQEIALQIQHPKDDSSLEQFCASFIEVELINFSPESILSFKRDLESLSFSSEKTDVFLKFNHNRIFLGRYFISKKMIENLKNGTNIRLC